jgi:hypothetical protein
MDFLQDLFSKPYPSQNAAEVERLLAELIKIGRGDDFLSESRSTPGFNIHCRHKRAIEIGARLDEIGGLDLMLYAYRHVRRKTSKTLGEHLEYCWDQVGKWRA